MASSSSPPEPEVAVATITTGASSSSSYRLIECLADDYSAGSRSLLRALLNKLIPSFWSDGVPDAVREKIALRYSEEELSGFDQLDDERAAPSTSVPAIDVARSVEEVLCTCLRENKVTGLVSLEEDGAVLFSHDLHQFILQKRSTLPRSSLKLLRESILGGHCPTTSFLKESTVQRKNGSEFEEGNNLSPTQGYVAFGSDNGFVNFQEPSRGFDDVATNLDRRFEMFMSDKHRLMDSQIHANIDSSCDLLEQDVCIQCNKGGQLLSCSTKGCGLTVHKSCVEPSVSFEAAGLYYCPFCVYIRATITYRRAEKHVLQARNALSAFISRDSVQGHLKKLSPADIPGETTQAGVNGHKDHPHSIHSHEDQTNRSKESSLRANDQHERGDVDVCSEGNLFCRYSEASNVDKCGASHNAEVNQDETVSTKEGDKEEQQHRTDATIITSVCEVPNHDTSRAQEKDILGSVNDSAHIEKLNNHEQIRAASGYDTGGEASISQPSKRIAKKNYDKLHHARGTAEDTNVTKRTKSSGSSKHVIVENQEKVRAAPDHADDQEALNSQSSERPAKRTRRNASTRNINDHQKNFVNPKTEISSSGSSKKRVPQPKRYFSQHVELGRRQKLFWTSDEEEVLKDAMQRFVVDSDGNFPWTKILEFGRHVFHKTRQPGDLKDKWRNIRKKEVKQ